MNDMTDIEKNVMRRVRKIYILRMIVSGAVFAASLTLLALYGIGREVWVAMVFKNGPSGFLAHTLYLAYAFEHTRFVVQALSLIALVSVIYLARETARFISNTVVLARI